MPRSVSKIPAEFGIFLHNSKGFLFEAMEAKSVKKLE